jgi:hypothetical protein
LAASLRRRTIVTIWLYGPAVPGRNQSNAFSIHAAGMPLVRAISRAYGIPEHRILGPSWLATEK